MVRTDYYGLPVDRLPDDLIVVVERDTRRFERTVEAAMWLHVLVVGGALVAAFVWRCF